MQTENAKPKMQLQVFKIGILLGDFGLRQQAAGIQDRTSRINTHNKM